MSYFLHGVSEDSVIQQFSNWLYSTAFRPKHSITINADGNIHRYSLERDKAGATSGAYALHLDGRPAGFCQDWHDSATKLTWKYVLSDDERREYARQQNDPQAQANAKRQRKEAERKKAEDLKRQQENQQQARAMALREYQNAFDWAHETYVYPHPYFQAKFIDTGIYLDILKLRISPDYCLAKVHNILPGGLCKLGEILVPMRNITTSIFQSLIHIPTNGNQEGKFSKLIYKDTSIKGAAHWIFPERSKNADTLLTAEGITTALACAVLMGGKTPVFSTGSCGNLFSVCKALRQKFSNIRICVMADNDKATEAKTGKNPGIEAAEECVNAGVADYFKAPPVAGDWYDFLKEVKTKNTKEGN